MHPHPNPPPVPPRVPVIHPASSASTSGGASSSSTPLSVYIPLDSPVPVSYGSTTTTAESSSGGPVRASSSSSEREHKTMAMAHMRKSMSGARTDRIFKSNGAGDSLLASALHNLAPAAGGERTTFTHFPGDYNPETATCYWQPDIVDGKRVITVVVPFFNEEMEELRETLMSLHASEELLAIGGFRLHVLLVMDGWSKASPSMRNYVSDMFPTQDPRKAWGFSIPALDPKAKNVDTYMVQRVGRNGQITPVLIDIERRKIVAPPDMVDGSSPVDDSYDSKRSDPLSPGGGLGLGLDGVGDRRGSGAPTPDHFVTIPPVSPTPASPTTSSITYRTNEYMYVSLLVKRDNRRKHNAHVWFLASFAPYYNSEFVFLTDCGTLFDEQCLPYLVLYIDEHPSCAAVSGRQRVMSAAMQARLVNPDDRKDEGIFSFEHVYRWAQCFDYEASTASFTGAFSAAGMLPVVPGPCGMYRFDHIYDSRGRMMKLVNQLQAYIGRMRESQAKLEKHTKDYHWYIKRLEEFLDSFGDGREVKYDPRDDTKGGIGSGTPPTLVIGAQDTLVRHNHRALADELSKMYKEGNKATLDMLQLCNEWYNRMNDIKIQITDGLNVLHDLELDDKRKQLLPGGTLYLMERDKRINPNDVFGVKDVRAHEERLRQQKIESYWMNEDSLRTRVDDCERTISSLLVKMKNTRGGLHNETQWKAELQAAQARRHERALRAREEAEESQRVNEEAERKKVAKAPVDAIDYYLSEVHKNPDETDLLTGSLLLAEDRILSYAAVVRTKTRTYTAYEPRASFYFQAEVDENTLLPQRRRWINGTIAGYLWLWQNIGLLWQSHLWPHEKLLLTFLLALQSLMYVCTAFSPALFATGLYFALESALPSNEYTIWLLLLYTSLYVIFVYVHATQDQKKVVVWLFRLVCLVNMVINPLMMTRAVIDVIHANNQVTNTTQIINDTHISSLTMYTMGLPQMWTGGNHDDVQYTTYSVFDDSSDSETFDALITFKNPTRALLLSMVIANLVLPWILTILHGPFEVLWMLRSVVQFYLFLPTMIGYFMAYSFCRIWELTWGNRPSDQLTSLAHTKSQEAAKKIKEGLRDTSSYWCWLVVSLNLIAIVLLLVPWTNKQTILLGVAFVVFSAALIQMVISLIWLIFNLVFRRLPSYAFHAVFNCCCCTFRRRLLYKYRHLNPPGSSYSSSSTAD